MDLNFEKGQQKNRVIATRLTEDEFQGVKKLASRYQRNMSETVRTIVKAALREYGLKGPKNKA